MTTTTRALLDLARQELAPRTWAQRTLLLLGALLLASSVVHGGIALAAAVEGAAWSGSVSWRKPVLFGFSFGVLLVSVVWVLRQLPDRRRLGATVVWLVGVASVAEVSLITVQRWRGVPSHFNAETAMDTAVWQAMAVLVMVTVLGLAVLLGWAARDLRHHDTRWTAAVLGIAGVLVAGWLGSDMAAAGEEVVAATGRVPEELVFGAAGSAKVAHALAMHGLQVLIVLAVLLGVSRFGAAARTALTAAGAVAYAMVVGAVTATAYAGRSWTAPETIPAVVGSVGVAGLVGVGWVTLAGMRGRRIGSVATGRLGARS
ncbi:hypothetical protein [Modestobacter marinus]|uniref:hypothetical protein n=1 Tax=Modestobacter marinus TaxID=477641 RepID=UPI00201AED86|nr:hypothetical protein [Modestobacter marinus]